MGAIGSTKMAGSRLSRRLLNEKASLRDGLRIRVPQATNLPVPADDDEDTDDDGDEDDDSDDDDDEDTDDESEDSDDPEQPQPQPSNQPPEVTERPPPVTLTHAPPPVPTTDPSDEPSGIPPPPPPPPADSAVESSQTETTSLPSETTLSSILSTTTFASVPSETAPASETEEFETIQGTSTTLTGTASGIPTVDPDSGSNEASDSGSPDRAADIGIILGTFVLAALLVAGGIFFYRWRLRRKGPNLGDIPPEKELPTSRDTDELGLVGGHQEDTQRGVHHYSSWAAFNPNPTDAGPTSFYYGDDKSDLDRRHSETDLTQAMPLPPPPAAAAYKPYRREADQNGVSPPESPVLFQMQGAAGDDVPQVQVTSASAGQGQPMGRFPPGQGYRQSLDQTEGTESTEGTWRTWGVDQNQATHERTWKDRYMR